MENIALRYLETAKVQIKAEEDRQVAIIKERVVREMQPKYAEVEKIKAEELNRLVVDYNAKRNTATEQYNATLSALQSKLDADKTAVIESVEKKKADMLNQVLATETYQITKDCEKAIAKLDAQIKEIKE